MHSTWLGIAAILLIPPSVSAQSTEPAPPAIDRDVLRIARIRNHAAGTLGRLPNYTCLQTIERSMRRTRSRRFELVDTLRVEVALVGSKELFAWPGEGRFQERQLSEMIGNGTIGNGNFALHARSVFLSNVPRFQFQGLVPSPTGDIFRYTYNVPLIHSGYSIKVGNHEGIVGYSGSFEVDAKTLDLRELVVTADDIPPHLQVQSATNVMRYARVPIGGSDFLLPQFSELVMLDLHGTESRNRATFSDCRQYTGESVVRFDDAPAAEPAAPPPPVVDIELPDGLYLELRLEDAIAWGSTAIGDRVTATVVRGAKHKGTVLVPKDAIAHARVRAIEKSRDNRGDYLRIWLVFTELEFPGARAPLTGFIESVSPLINVRVLLERDMIYLRGNRLELAKGSQLFWRSRTSRDKENSK